MNIEQFRDRARARWKSDLVPSVREWQHEVRLSGADAGIVDLDLVDQDDPLHLVWRVHLRCGASRAFVLDLALH